ncbi:nucleoside phosphorylase domain-containing protein [Aspergillus varians]
MSPISNTSSPAVPPNEEFTVGWICMKPLESVAAREAFDESYGKTPQTPAHPSDQNSYNLGRIGRNNIVIAVHPTNSPCPATAAQISADIKTTFPSIQVGVMVTTGSGIPSSKHDIRLGDVIVGTPDRTFKGIVGVRQSSVAAEGILERFATPGADEYSRLLVTAANALKADRLNKVESKIPAILAGMFHWFPGKREAHSYQGSSHDKLFAADYAHQLEGDEHCLHCDAEKNLVSRAVRNDTSPVVHYGTIASTDRPVTDTGVRDLVEARFGAKGVQVGAAGLINAFPTLVICGVGDYADTHSNDHWSRYAAAVAAAYTKELLLTITRLHSGRPESQR